MSLETEMDKKKRQTDFLKKLQVNRWPEKVPSLIKYLCRWLALGAPFGTVL